MDQLAGPVSLVAADRFGVGRPVSAVESAYASGRAAPAAAALRLASAAAAGTSAAAAALAALP